MVPKTNAEMFAEMKREREEQWAGIYEGQTAERDLLLFLRSLSEHELRDVMALFYLGRENGDDFEGLRESPNISLEHLPFHLADKRDLEPSLINGLKRLSECRG